MLQITRIILVSLVFVVFALALMAFVLAIQVPKRRPKDVPVSDSEMRLQSLLQWTTLALICAVITVFILGAILRLHS